MSTVSNDRFALALMKGAICLVQMSNIAPSPLMVVDVRVFRHEFITIFRYSHSTTVHPSDIQVLEVLDEHSAAYDEEKETAFLPRDVMDRMQKMSMSFMPHSSPHHRLPHQHTYARSKSPSTGMRPARVSRIY